MKTFCFTVDDNIRFFKDLTEKRYNSIFEHPYLAVYKRLHDEFGLKVQLNLFYRLDDFDLSMMTDAYYSEWEANSDWLKLSFHSDYENVRPYEFSGYDEVYKDCKNVNDQIVRFASPKALAKTTTVHYCVATDDGLRAITDNNVLGLLGLFGTKEKPRTSYNIDDNNAKLIREGSIYNRDGMAYASIDIVLNAFSKEDILTRLSGLLEHNDIRVMIHEQYFYADYKAYQPDFEEKLRATFAFLTKNEYNSSFFEELICHN